MYKAISELKKLIHSEKALTYNTPKEKTIASGVFGQKNLRLST